jgi:hypothetical protein
VKAPRLFIHEPHLATKKIGTLHAAKPNGITLLRQDTYPKASDTGQRALRSTSLKNELAIPVRVTQAKSE